MVTDYLPLLWEAAGTKTFWQMASDIRYFAMLYFDGFNLTLALILAVIGASIGAVINYGIGRLLSICQFNGVSTIPQEKYNLWQKRFAFWMPVISLFSFIHLVGVILCAAGFLRVPLHRIVPFLLAGQAFYYGYYYFSAIS